jgi:hypothetical protein
MERVPSVGATCVPHSLTGSRVAQGSAVQHCSSLSDRQLWDYKMESINITI